MRFWAAFLCLLPLRLLGALVLGVADCDETFNYWEPLHFLLYGHGLQTWEYAPQVRARSLSLCSPRFARAPRALRASPPPAPRASHTGVRLADACTRARMYTYHDVHSTRSARTRTSSLRTPRSARPRARPSRRS